MNINELEIIHETAKAYLFGFSGVEQWVPKKCIKKSGDLYKNFADELDAKIRQKDTFGGENFKKWTGKDGGLTRYYFDDSSYVQVAERRARGSYEQHRGCKGEKFYNVTATDGVAISHVNTVEQIWMI